jgi:hypothetical protein
MPEAKPQADAAQAPAAGVALTGVRRLTPDNCKVFEGSFSLLHCEVKGDQLYRGVFGVLMFPISHPNRYISLRFTDVDDKAKEIGVIESLDVFSEAYQKLIRASIGKQYFEQEIQRIYEIKCEYGLLFFDAETKRGHEQFMIPWRHDRAEDFGAKGKVLLDALDNRYIIPNVSELPAADRRRFTSYIYW